MAVKALMTDETGKQIVDAIKEKAGLEERVAKLENEKFDKSNIAQGTGTSEDKAMSQRATSEELEKKFDKSNIVQSTGDDTDKVMSQAAATKEFDKLSEDISDEATERQKAVTAEKNRAVARENEIEELFTLPTQEAVDKWLDEHPEATTTVQDKSLTIDKMVVGTLGYVTPEMFGAKGDGVTDDTAAIQTALDSGNKYVRLMDKTYLTTSPLIMPTETTLEGTANYGGSIIKNVGCDAVHFTENSRFSHLKHISLYGDMTHTGIAFTTTTAGNLTIPKISVENVTINNQKYGMTDSFVNGAVIDTPNITLWDSIFREVVCYINEEKPDCGFYFNNKTTGFNLLFERCNHGTGGSHFDNVRAVFIACNFGLSSKRTIYAHSNTQLSFIGCNFECSEPLTNVAPMQLNSPYLSFANCIFSTYTNDETSCKFFDIRSGANVLVFENNRFSTNSNSGDENFWQTSLPTAKIALEFRGYNNSVPVFGAKQRTSLRKNGILNDIYDTTPAKAVDKGYVGYSAGDYNLLISDGETWHRQTVICGYVAPTDYVENGVMWYDRTQKKLKIYCDSQWVEV